jgi:hypothetical protein
MHKYCLKNQDGKMGFAKKRLFNPWPGIPVTKLKNECRISGDLRL